ncbi:STAS domain-containing protein [Isoptericola variabilis]|uniref:STAS domain-containing protein n=1 Tax=Isoptericola variabilis (strain 225) TaxID=743718 RepID=F6FVL4_ISOV2|nr:STAS domain-containing protein [Isoptericola variabilis]AEG44441.1 hypothetical protein Isova_1689 [Isoptericola variabilis 225]TWH28287.1 anti-sigma B factor antagonist [Isoptericola variabilis J7]
MTGAAPRPCERETGMRQRGDVHVEQGGALWVMEGEIDNAVRERREAQLRDAAAGRRITVDLTRVTFMDSGGLRLLYHAAEHSPEPPVLRGVPHHVAERLDVAGATTMFVVVPRESSQG